VDTIAGLFSFITTPVSWVIVQFHTVYGAIFGPDTGWAWGLSIVSLVILIRICLIPLFVKQIRAQRGLQLLQPKMAELRKKYGSDRQRMSEELMKLYKETGTNPFSSCLPILAQSPFFFALYHVLNSIASNDTIGVINTRLLESAQKAHIFGAPLAAKVTDGDAKVQALGSSITDVRVVTAIMIVLMSFSQFYTQRQLMTKNVDTTVKTPFMQQQKMLMYVFPIMFAVFGINFPVGVLVYWLTTNVWTMGQQMYVINQNPTPGSKAQDQYLQRLLKGITAHNQVRSKRRRNIVQAIVAKGPDRNDNERKFITSLAKTGLVAQADGTVIKGEAVAEGDSTAPKRQQPKRQPKSKRQTGGAQQGTSKAAGAKPSDASDTSGEPAKTSLQKKDDAPQDSKPKPAGKTGNGAARAKSGPRKGQQRPKHPSKK